MADDPGESLFIMEFEELLGMRTIQFDGESSAQI